MPDLNPNLLQLPLEKQFTHRSFCDAVEQIQDMAKLKEQVCKLHLLYLSQQRMFALLAKQEMGR